MAKSRSYSMDENIIKIFKSMKESLKKKTKRLIELILETALNNPETLRDYLEIGVSSPPPFDISQGFNHDGFIMEIIDGSEGGLYYNMIIQSKDFESRISKGSYAKFQREENVLKIKHYEGKNKYYIKINVNDILDVDLFDTISMKSERYKYITPAKQPSYLYLRIKLYKNCILKEVEGYAKEKF